MALTRDFRDTVQVRARRDPAFRQALLQEGVVCLLAGDMETGKAALRDYIHATIGFAELAAQIHKPSKSLLRMFSSKGNPQARNLLEVIRYLQQQEGICLEVTMRRDLTLSNQTDASGSS
jgi:DNA-binding phage protein